MCGVCVCVCARASVLVSSVVWAWVAQECAVWGESCVWVCAPCMNGMEHSCKAPGWYEGFAARMN